jgi:hypothetical protein
MARVTFQETMDRLLLLVRAGYPVIYIVSHEEARVLDGLVRIVRVLSGERRRDGLQAKRLVRWYEGTGLREVCDLEPFDGAEPYPWLDIPGFPERPKEEDRSGREGEDALKLVRDAGPHNFEALSDVVAVFFDLHPFLMMDRNTGISGSLVRPVRNAADRLRNYYDVHRASPAQRYKTIVIVAPSAAGLSLELERDLIQVEFPLPEREELLATLSRMLSAGRLTIADQPPTAEVAAVCRDTADPQEYRSRLCELVAGAGCGLTLEDYRSGLNMFAVRQEPLSSRHMEDMMHLKSKSISSPALQYTPHVEVELGGLEAVIDWIGVHRDAASSVEIRNLYHLPPPRGVMLLGVSGGGKSQLAKLVAREFKLALLRLDVGALFGSYIGESEEKTRQALRLAEVLAPVVLWIDEIDKAFQGIGDGGDSGVSARVFGQFLTWLAEKEDSVFVVTTANDFRSMLKRFPELGRKGRFDEIFWVDLPGNEALQTIFRIYLRKEYEKQYLQLADGELEELARQHGIPDLPEDGTPLDRFCWLLSQTMFSERLTGAEIEYAITNAKYLAYQEGKPLLSARHVVTAVLAAKAQALYRPGSETAQLLEEELLPKVRAAGWPRVD